MTKANPLLQAGRRATAPEPAPAPAPDAKPARAPRGTAKRVSLALRVKREDWEKVGDQARAENISGNQYLIKALQFYQAAHGYPVIEGDDGK